MSYARKVKRNRQRVMQLILDAERKNSPIPSVRARAQRAERELSKIERSIEKAARAEIDRLERRRVRDVQKVLERIDQGEES